MNQNAIFGLLFCISFAVTGCSGDKDFDKAPEAALSIEQERSDRSSAGRNLAYEHTLGFDAREDKVAAIHETARAACSAAVAHNCVILQSRLDTGEEISAYLRLRAEPDGIRQIIALLSVDGKLVSQSTIAEDLELPLQDSSRKLAMLADYRSKLEALQERPDDNIDALIKINRELASTQSEIEAVSGRKAYLEQRVATEILNLHINAHHSRSAWKSVSSALSEFGQDLAEGIASVITGLAFLIPWSLVVLAFVWASVKLWSRRRRGQ